MPLAAQSPAAWRRGGFDLLDLSPLLDQQLVRKARLIGEALDVVEVRDPGIARGVGDAQAGARRAVGAWHRVRRDAKTPLVRLIGASDEEHAGCERRSLQRPGDANSGHVPTLGAVGICHAGGGRATPPAPVPSPPLFASAIRLPVKLS